MARIKAFCLGPVLLLLFAFPAHAVVTSDGAPVSVRDTWQLKFVKLADTSDGSMPNSSLIYQ